MPAFRGGTAYTLDRFCHVILEGESPFRLLWPQNPTWKLKDTWRHPSLMLLPSPLCSSLLASLGALPVSFPRCGVLQREFSTVKPVGLREQVVACDRVGIGFGFLQVRCIRKKLVLAYKVSSEPLRVVVSLRSNSSST